LFKHMLVATDGSKLPEKAIAYAISIAAAVNTRVTPIYVVQPVHMMFPTPLPATAMAFVEKTHHCQSRNRVCG
jgi:nucleotide-binding universal stress UspA family protein